MTKNEIVEKCGRNIYEVWLEIAMRHFDERDPENAFRFATNFVKELLKQNPEF